MALRKMSYSLMMYGILDFLKKSVKNGRKTLRRAEIINSLIATVAAALLHEEIWLAKSTYFNPLSDTSMLRFQSGVWNQQSQNLFSLRFRIRRPDFANLLLHMGLASEVGGTIQFKYLCTNFRYRVPADFAMMVMLRRLAYPCRFSDLVCEFGKGTTYICEAFHSAIHYIYENLLCWL